MLADLKASSSTTLTSFCCCCCKKSFPILTFQTSPLRQEREEKRKKENPQISGSSSTSAHPSPFPLAALSLMRSLLSLLPLLLQQQHRRPPPPSHLRRHFALCGQLSEIITGASSARVRACVCEFKAPAQEQSYYLK